MRHRHGRAVVGDYVISLVWGAARSGDEVVGVRGNGEGGCVYALERLLHRAEQLDTLRRKHSTFA